ncbi:UDP-glycosyltransferase 82A1-like [Curcuma longa]|uniref:UDP-glycosyltransferase 82A1-like n=1 Tax=Curcuma longa TaxID=136217 RepID=UPI003D9E63EB
MGQRCRSRSRIVLVPFPAQGHVSPMLHLARLLHARGLDVTVVTPDFIHRRLVAAAGAGGGCRFVSIPSGLDAEGDATPEFAAIELAMENHMPAHLERLLLPPPAPEAAEEEEEEAAVACVVVDLLASWAIPVAKRCGVHVAGFWPAMLATFRIISAIPELIHRGLISEYGSPLNHQAEYSQQEQVVAEESLTLSGQAKLSTKELPWLVGNPATQRSRFIFWLRVLERAKSVQYLLVNSFPDEAGHQREQSSHQHHPRPLPIGPLMLAHRTTNISMWEADRSCLRWLQQHPPGSVVYVSFGSWVAPLSPESIAEIALGLEAAGRPFLWVLKEGDSWRAGLPRGFPGNLPGKIVSWAPQEEVLRSPAVGCYLTHCGWNSTLEAIQYEKRLLCHPVAGDQFVNAAFIVKVWGIGAMLDGAGRSAVEDGIRRAMESDEGEEMQASVERLRRRVMGDGEGSSEAVGNLQCFLDQMKQNMQ